jgi:hypothetical protein
MGIREKLNQNPWIATGGAGAVIVIAIVVVVMQAFGRGGPPSDIVTNSNVFFTTDDGKTWFADDVKNIPPFTKDGKEAVRAHVYRTSDGTEFVGYLERYSPASKRALAAALAKPVEEQLEDPYASVQIECKKPGETTWVSMNDPRAQAIMNVVSPKGAGDKVSHVSPAK